MDKLLAPLVLGILLLLSSENSLQAGQEKGLTEEQIKALVPEAASISKKDFKALAQSPAPSAENVKSESLSLLLFSLNPADAAKKNPKVLEDFEFLIDTPNPSRIAEAISKSDFKGYATFIQPGYITSWTSTAKGKVATGTVSFKVEGLYRGKVEYTARMIDGTWRIEEFRLPHYGLTTRRGEDGIWKEVKPRAKDR